MVRSRYQPCYDAAIKSYTGTDDHLWFMVESARKSPRWNIMVRAIIYREESVGYNPGGSLATLKHRRLKCLSEVSKSYPIKVVTKEALDGNLGSTDGKISNSKMVWIYTLYLSVPSLVGVVKGCRRVLEMEGGGNTLKGCGVALWGLLEDK